MAPSSDAPQSISTTSSAQQAGALPRLFNFDLPALKQSGQAFAEQADHSAIRRVLDIASGTGAWTISAAQAHPEAQFVGIERRLSRHVRRLSSPLKRRGVSRARLDKHAISFLFIESFWVVAHLRRMARSKLYRGITPPNRWHVFLLRSPTGKAA